VQQRLFSKLGAFAWLALAMMFLETLLSIKFGRGLYTQPWPWAVVAAWGLAGALFAVGLAVWQLRLWRRAGGAAKRKAS
jgi:phosphatidylserine synthase 2